MKNLAGLILAVGAVIAAPFDEDPGKNGVPNRPNYDKVDYYDCSGKENGLYLHPNDCTRFITCIDSRAADFSCPPCDLTNSSGCRGSQYLVYDVDKHTCNWPNQTKCHTSGPKFLIPNN
ncbi:uncharacterized protein LOC118433737 [Folsomia candida]|uniref:uncharacterized protein LOC118433737 n=1 Tax=Folsomia candida TaxID=158441 RepID=UPI001604C51B|nr:uncharacterized protein LOC118433737 [Folsomia candida]